MDTADTPRPRHELARLSDLPPALRSPLSPASQQSKAAGGGSAISPRLVLRALTRHWWQALLVWIVGSASLVALVYLNSEPTYRSTSQLMVNIDSTNPYTVGGPVGPRTLDNATVRTQITLITSPNVLSQVATDPKIARLSCIREADQEGIDPETFLKELIEVEPVSGTTLINVSASTRNPAEAPVIVNAVVKAFEKAEEGRSTTQNKRATEALELYLERTLDPRIKQQKDELVRRTREAEFPEAALMMQNHLAAAPGSGEGGGADAAQNSQFTIGVSEYQKLHQELLDLEFEEVEVRSNLEAIRRQAAATDPRAWVERRIEQFFKENGEVQALLEALRDTNVQLAEAQRRIRNPADPSLSRLRNERQRLLDRYEQLWAEMEPALRAQLADEESNPAQIVRRAEGELATLEYRRNLVQQKLDRVKLDEQSRGEAMLLMSFERAELAQLQAMKKQVQARLEALLFEGRDNDSFIVVAEARPSRTPEVNKRDKLMAAMPLGMLGLVLGLVTLVEMRGGRVSGADDLSGRISAEIFSVPPLPTVRSESRGRLEGPGRDPKFEQFVQQLDHVRVALCGEGGHDGRGRCVLITSAVGGEGKTTLAAQLAVRCAEAGASTVLIDADLRRATLGRLFEVPDCPGLSDVLRGDATLEDALVPINQVGGCQLLPAGSPEANPNRILRGKNFAPMLERLRKTFDVVIIDTSPVLPVPDALILGRLADGAVLATRHDKSRFPAVERANDLLAGAGIPVLGVVVNGARPSGVRGGGAYYTAYTYRSDRIPEDVDPSPAG